MALFSVLLPREIIIMDKQNIVLAIRALADRLRYSAKLLFSTNSNAFDSFCCCCCYFCIYPQCILPHYNQSYSQIMSLSD